MKRINVMVSDEAKARLVAYQKHLRLTTQDEALDKILTQLEVPRG
jgi:hypothetical protein